MSDSVLICNELLTVTHDNLIGLIKRRIGSMGTRLSDTDRFHLCLFTKRQADDDLPMEDQKMQKAYAAIGIEPIDQRCRMTVIMHDAPDDLLPYPTKNLLTDFCASIIYACEGEERRDAWKAHNGPQPPQTSKADCQPLRHGDTEIKGVLRVSVVSAIFRLD